MSIFEKLFGNKKSDANAPSDTVSVSQAEEIFEYGRLKNLVGTGSSRWWDKPKQLKKMPVILPPHFQWSAHPRHAYLAVLENGRLEYHYSEKGDSRLDLCPVTTNKEHIRYIDGKFIALYHELGLPASLAKLREAAQKKPSGRDWPNDKMSLLKVYLESGKADFFHEALSERDDVLMWVDWREEDESIVGYCEAILKTGSLTAKTRVAEQTRRCAVVIDYKGISHEVDYEEDVPNRDDTIKALNDALKPDYEIRFCQHSDGSDTLAFLPLSAEQWRELENASSQEAVDACFRKISAEIKLFG